MHFYLVTLNIVPPIVFVENTTEIKTLLSAIFNFLFLLHSANIHSLIYAKSLKLKLTNENASNVIYKVKSYFPQPVQGAAKIRLMQRLESESRFLLGKKYFIFLK